jgi:excisionase family DNA binding protein
MLRSINETADALRIGRTNIYLLIKSGKLSTVKIGRRTLVKASSIEALINEHEVMH